jgi:F-type H+-transporting ATPase subunit b
MSIQWYQLLFQIINFGVLVFLLKRFMYKPIITIIKQRNKKIEDSIKAAEASLKEKAKLEQIKKKAIEEAEKEAVLIIDKAKKQANIEGKDLIDHACEQAKVEVDKKFVTMTEKLAEQEKNITLKITDLVIKATSKVLKGSLTDKEQKQIIDQEIKKLRKIK